MVLKKCPDCGQNLGIACKTCSCGHVFISKKLLQSTEQEKEGNDEETTTGECKDDRVVVEHGSHDDENNQATDTDYEELISFREAQITINDRLDVTLADVIADQDDLKKDSRSFFDKIMGEITSLKVVMDDKLAEVTESLERKFEKIVKEQGKRINTLETQVKILETKIKGLEENKESDSSESEDDESESDSQDSVINVSTISTQNRFDPLQNHPPENDYNQQERENTCTPTGNNKQQSEADDESNILIMSDSMMKGIIEKKLSVKNHIKKEYVRGGTAEMINFIANFESERQYNQIVVHTGTNDIFKKSLDEINKNIEEIVQKCKSRWPNAKIILSGIIFHRYNNTKNDIIDTVNSATQRLCQSEGNHAVQYMNNDHIATLKDGSIDQEVYYDNLHLNSEKGMRKLAANLKKYLNLNRRIKDDRKVPRRQIRNENYQRFKGPSYYRNTRSQYGQHWPKSTFSEYGNRSTHEGLWKALQPLANWI
ncbi:uncharacterized protein LOC116301560, partial [Actinia tenebrosa]|uniref:Uncharacterized protein LOC116301560 n=1 Tax=Actinia tenebrosa TaxID=6105 RepID=A0A6P8IIJ8_ACTTE